MNISRQAATIRVKKRNHGFNHHRRRRSIFFHRQRPSLRLFMLPYTTVSYFTGGFKSGARHTHSPEVFFALFYGPAIIYGQENEKFLTRKKETERTF